MTIPQRNSEISRMAAIARLGFDTVPIGIHHNTMGLGNLHMSSEGLRFVPFNGANPLIMTWEEFDRGPMKKGQMEMPL